MTAEVLQMRDYQTREELDLILLRSISRSLGFEWASDQDTPEGDEFVGPDGDCA